VTLDAFAVLTAALLGALIGSFSNVLIYRMPRRESVAFPPSHCPKCDRPLSALDLVPVLSWVALRGRCRSCRAPISARYPLVELLTAGGYALLAILLPWSQVGPSLVGLCLLFTLLLVIAFIDAETRTIPDELVLPGIALGVMTGLLNDRSGGVAMGLPGLADAAQGALLGAGVISLIAIFGAWVLRRFRERQYPEWPVNYQSVALAALVGAWLGLPWGVGAGVLAVLASAAMKRVLPVPELLTVGGLLVSLVLSVNGSGGGVIVFVQNALASAGGMSLVAAVYWAARYWGQPDADTDEPADPEAMGFGDVKLAALIGAFLGWQMMLVSIAFAVFAGAIIGVLAVALGRGNKLAFAPYLALGAFFALMWGGAVLSAYRGMLGV
jgi:leader peptidase (prepilin peptidase)/N-methyltransferase